MMQSIRYSLLLLLVFCLALVRGQDGWQAAEANNKPLPRHENAFVKAGGKFYLLGGRGIKPVGIFDPATKTWSEGAPMPLPVSHFQAVSHQGLIYVLGALVGDWPSETPLTHILIYNPLTDNWLIGPEIPPHRQRGAAGAVAYKGKIYLACGIVNGHTSGWVPWLDAYDPTTNSWKELPDAPRARDHVQAAVVQDQLVLTGGRKSGYKDQGFEATIAETDVYDFNMGSWRSLPSPSGDIPTQRAGCTAVSVGNEVIVIGGESGSQVPAHAEVEALDITTGTWRSLPSLQKGRHGTQVLFAEGNLYIAAGCGNRGGSPELDSFETYALPGGVTGSGDSPITAGVAQLSETAVDFGAVRPFDSRTVLVTLSHVSGNQGIPVVYAIPSATSEFSVDVPYPLPYVLPPGGSLTMQLKYAPTSGHRDEGQLHIKFMDRGKLQPLEIQLRGN